MGGCRMKGFVMAYYSVPCGLITTVFSLAFSSLVALPVSWRGALFNYTTIVKLVVKKIIIEKHQKRKKNRKAKVLFF